MLLTILFFAYSEAKIRYVFLFVLPNILHKSEQKCNFYFHPSWFVWQANGGQVFIQVLSKFEHGQVRNFAHAIIMRMHNYVGCYVQCGFILWIVDVGLNIVSWTSAPEFIVLG